MKKILTLFLAAILVIACAAPAFAAASSDFKFIIEVDDSTVAVGETVKVNFKIESNTGDDFTIYAMQDYIGFDTEFFEFVDGSLNVASGFSATEQGNCVFVNRYSGSRDFENGDTVLSFELKALKSGDSEFTHSIVEMIDDDMNFFSVEKVGADVAVSDSTGGGDVVTRYNITLDYNSRYGDVDISREIAAAGTKITIEPTAKTGYDIDDVIVTRDSNGKEIRVTENIIKGTYTFTMPADDVTVEVVFVPVVGDEYRITLDGDYENGEVGISHKRAAKGETVDIFPEPDEGYEVESVTVKKTAGGGTVKVTANTDGSYSFKMPGEKVTVSVSFKKSAQTDKPDSDTTAPITPGPGEVIHICPSEPYADVDQTLWYHDAIDYVISYNLMNGYDAVTFGPNDTTTRAMIATIIWRLEGSPVSTAAIPFSDIAEGQWYTEAVRWAAENGIVNGLGDGTFAPEMAITREQFAAMIYRYEQYKGGGFTGLWMYQLNFPDLDSLSSWAVEAISWCNMNGIIKGNGMGQLNPLGEATRAEAAQILMNYKTMAK